MPFPRGFLWGAGTSAHQVEGDNSANDWWSWESDPNSTSGGASANACEHWTRYAEDLDLLASLGLNSYRFSVEWSRVEPADGAFSTEALDHYRDVCDAARARGLEPVVVFHHFTTPSWVAAQGGWSEESTIARFVRYCAKVASHLRGSFTYACTINEPNVVAAFGYELGLFPPGMRDAARKELVARVLMRAHREARDAIRRSAPGVRVGIALSMNEWAATPGANGQLSALKHSMEDVFFEATRGDDFIGVQNYTRLHVGPDGIAGPPEGSRTTQTGFEYRPEALGVCVRRASEMTGLPVMVTENGICTLDDAERIEYTAAALRALEECIGDGVDVIGYLHWSALDSFEWILGYWPKYGLIEVDRATQLRRPRPSAHWLGRVARSNCLVAP